MSHANYMCYGWIRAVCKRVRAKLLAERALLHTLVATIAEATSSLLQPSIRLRPLIGGPSN